MRETGISHFLLIINAARHKPHWHSGALTMLKNVHREFTHKGLAVAVALARHDNTRAAQHAVEACGIKQQLRTRPLLGTKELHERIAESACCSCSLFIAMVEAKMPGTRLGKVPRSCVKRIHHRRVGTLLRSKHTSSPICATQRIGDIRSKYERTVFSHLAPIVTHGAKHSYPTIRRRATSKSHDKPAHATAIGIHYHLTHTPRRRAHWIALLWLDKRKPGGPCYLHNRRVAHDAILCLNAAHQGVMSSNRHAPAACSAEKGVEQSLATIAHLYLFYHASPSHAT